MTPTCILDPGNALYFSDLQGLTNISNSVSTGRRRHLVAPTAWARPTPRTTGCGSPAPAACQAGNLILYQDFDATDTSASGGNQLVETESTDGTHFLPVVNSNTSALTDCTAGCAGAAIQDCVTGNEGISGNQVVDPATGNVYIAHTTTEGSSGAVGVRVVRGQVTQGTPPTATWAESPNLDARAVPEPHAAWTRTATPRRLAGENFASIAARFGRLPVRGLHRRARSTMHSSSDANFGALTAPEQIYVVHSLEPARLEPVQGHLVCAQQITG